MVCEWTNSVTQQGPVIGGATPKISCFNASGRYRRCQHYLHQFPECRRFSRAYEIIYVFGLFSSGVCSMAVTNRFLRGKDYTRTFTHKLNSLTTVHMQRYIACIHFCMIAAPCSFTINEYLSPSLVSIRPAVCFCILLPFPPLPVPRR